MHVIIRHSRVRWHINTSCHHSRLPPSTLRSAPLHCRPSFCLSTFYSTFFSVVKHGIMADVLAMEYEIYRHVSLASQFTMHLLFTLWHRREIAWQIANVLRCVGGANKEANWKWKIFLFSLRHWHCHRASIHVVVITHHLVGGSSQTNAIRSIGKLRTEK